MLHATDDDVENEGCEGECRRILAVMGRRNKGIRREFMKILRVEIVGRDELRVWDRGV